MLKQLYIRNLALVDELSIEFDYGLTVMSGETGAGKSMLLNALGLALGDRFNQSLLDPERQAGQVVAAFTIDNHQHPASQWLLDKDLAEEDQCVLRRSFTSSGNRCYVNNVQVTQTQIAQLGDMLIELHSQHQHHSLLRQPAQAQLFDSYCQQLPLVELVAHLYNRKQILTKEIRTLEASQLQANSDKQYLGFQLQELSTLAPEKGEYRQLDQKQKQLGKRQQLSEITDTLSNWLEGNASGDMTGALDFVSQMSRILVQMPFDDCKNMAQIFEQIEIQLGEASLQLRAMRDQEPLDNEYITQLEQRLSQWHALARKHSVEPEKIPDLLSEFRYRITQLDHSQEKLEELRAQLADLDKQHTQACDQLTSGRQKSTSTFAEEVTELMHSLAMPDATFRVELQQQAEPGAQGNEKVHFAIQTNPGAAEAPLNTIVSGGELSRISLAIHHSCNQAQQHSRCMVFDEIDVGMSGVVAERIGKLLRSLGKKYQVISVTHQPQVAARAHHHILASKKRRGHAVCVNLEPLEMVASVEEIARMLGSEGTRQQSLDLAHEMYRIGQS